MSARAASAHVVTYGGIVLVSGGPGPQRSHPMADLLLRTARATGDADTSAAQEAPESRRGVGSCDTRHPP